MTELLTSAQMRAIERAAIESGSVTGLELMERAGRGVVEAILSEWPELAVAPGALSDATPGTPPRTLGYLGQEEGGSAHRAVVLCGPGNNGGDGFVVARLLRERGWEVEVYLYGDAETLPPDARVNYERWCSLGEVRLISAWRTRDGGWGCDLLVDALFGIGLTRPVADLVDIFWNMEDMVDCFAIEPGHEIGRPAIVAVDLPSGLCADSGRMIGNEGYGRDAAAAHLTVTFHRAKPGHFLADGPECSGKVVVVDIGLTGETVGAIGLNAPSNQLRKRSGNKFSHGHALILSGPSGRGGAARLAARGALRIGAGLVTVGVPPEALVENAARLDAVKLRAVAGAEDLGALLSDRRINALCLGPGLGTGAEQAELVAAALAFHLPDDKALPLIDATDAQVAAWYRKHGHRPASVLDADALTILSRDPALFGALHDRCVLTPHGGEFARLFPDIAAKLAAPATEGPAFSKVDATREAAARAGCVVLYKGADTVIADPWGNCAVNAAVREHAAPWLATAGSGDVLAGFITGLLARGLSPFDAACTGAWLHVEAARDFGPGLIAEDLPEMLPKVFRRVLGDRAPA